jgi:hypothetical protein
MFTVLTETFGCSALLTTTLFSTFFAAVLLAAFVAAVAFFDVLAAEVFFDDVLVFALVGFFVAMNRV